MRALAEQPETDSLMTLARFRARIATASRADQQIAALCA